MVKMKETKVIKPLYINGLSGRVLNLPNTESKREILLLYGHHASIERMYSLAEEFQQFGTVTLPDFPGFGGMESFYKIGEKPTLDVMADYLAAFVKMRYSRKRVTIVAVSFGFLVATRMLQRFPELTERVDLLVSLVGFTHYEDFKMSDQKRGVYKKASRIMSMRFPAGFVQNILLTKPFINATYRIVANSNTKMKDASKKELKRRIAFEVILWRINDFRTMMFTYDYMFSIDLCAKKINLPVYHVAVDADQYFDNYLVEQHLNVIYNSVTMLEAKLHAHMPTIVANRAEIAPLIPDELRAELQKTP